MRLSPFHCEIARRIALGQRNKEILAEMRLSASRLSVLKANPLMKREVEKWRRLEEDKYRKGLEVFAEGAEKVAKSVVAMVDNPALGGQVRLAAAKEVLDRAGLTSRQEGAPGAPGEEMVFEQLLRVTKRRNGGSGVGEGGGEASYEDSGPMDDAVKQLQEDFLDAQPVEALEVLEATK